MPDLPFNKPGRFYRGNIHAHSTRSDGIIEPMALAEAYENQGYDFLAITDHFLEDFSFPITDTRNCRSSDFTTIIGAELHVPQTQVGAPWHLVALGIPLDFAPPLPDESAPAIARRAVDAGGFLGIAHPAWYTLSLDEALTIDSAHAVEVYNETCFYWNDRGDSWYMLELLLARGRRLTAFASDDAHASRPDMFGGWVQVRSTELSPEALVEALKAGDFYSSQGPEILDVTVTEDEISISCSPCSAILVTGVSFYTGSLRGTELCHATFPLEHFKGSYCRVTIIDQHGKH